jgi:hypothetical protein
VNLVTNGDVDVTLGDTQAKGPGTTRFTFTVNDQSIGVGAFNIRGTVVIKVTSPNGNPPPVQISGRIQ